MKALTLKMETVTLIGKGRYDLTCFVYSVCEINSKMFFLSRCFILGGLSYIWINTCSLVRGVLLGGGGVVLDLGEYSMLLIFNV
jgi:hypothetical protein